MTSFLVGIAILVIVVLAVSRSLLGQRDPDGLEENDYDNQETDGLRRRTEFPDRPDARREANAMVDDFVLHDAVDEDHNLTDMWDDDEIAGR
jgi:hypothetical protein